MINDIKIFGASEHNLKNIDCSFPRNALVVITGLSGSGKSSLAFDTIHAEGQRRYMETFSVYARQFLGTLPKSKVESIEGLSPCIAIEQKTVHKNPRSTVGTITEIYDFIRLLFAKIGQAYSYETGKKMVQYSQKQIVPLVLKKYENQKIYLLSPLVRSRKGHYKELFGKILKKGFTKVRVDGTLKDIEKGMQLERYKIHDIELVVDALNISDKTQNRLEKSLQTALKQGNGTVLILPFENLKPAYFSEKLMCEDTAIAYQEPEPNIFSFNSPKGACEKCKGLGFVEEISFKNVVPEDSKSIAEGGIAPLDVKKHKYLLEKIKSIAKIYDFTLETPLKLIPKKALQCILQGGKIEQENFQGLMPFLWECYQENAYGTQKWAKQYISEKTCENCKGSRLQKIALHFKINEKNIGQIVEMDILQLEKWLKNLEKKMAEKEQEIASEILKELQKRIAFLLNVGLDYLTLNRTAGSLSGGESQRIRLATQIGSELTGVLYILDEPSIGLHQRDNQRLIQALKNLQAMGNSVVVVEHDKDMIFAADYIIDMGPGAGKNGGNVLSQGNIKQLLKKNTLTSDYLSGKKTIPIPKKRRQGNAKKLILKGAKGNNLKNITATFPLGKMICLTGVSGSGKSSLISETLYPILNKHFYKALKTPLPYESIEGLENIDKIVAIDQSPIGRTPRSNPATYIGFFTEIRALFSQTPQAIMRGYLQGQFSFNVKGGRCETCKGAGVQTLEMNFLPDVQVICEECLGKRFSRATLQVRYKGKSITDILEMSVGEALVFFEAIPNIYRKIKTLEAVGLGYLTLGQFATTLSGGEAQRLKLAKELSKKSTGNTFYILDEPTTGLHFEDIRLLMEILNKLVEQGNTVLIIEHNMDVIKLADWIMDIGKEGGAKGGNLLFSGTPEDFIELKKGKSYTADFLKKEFNYL